MSTKKFQLGNASGNNVKGGKNNTKTKLTAAGIVAFGAATGAGYAAGAASENLTHEEDDDEKLEQSPEPNTEETSEAQSEQQQNETTGSQQEQAAEQTQPQSGDNITEPHPTDSHQPQPVDNNQPQPSNSDVHQPTPENPENADPNQVAQQIIAEQNIDPTDIDSPTIISVDELTTFYRADGSEMLVAAVHTPDGAQYLLADYDGDGYFTDVFDLSGNFVGNAEGNLMASDLEIMVNPNGGYIAQNDEPEGDDPTNDIITTSSPSHSNFAENSVITTSSDEDDVTDEELLAQLLEGGADEDEHLITYLGCVAPGYEEEIKIEQLLDGGAGEDEHLIADYGAGYSDDEFEDDMEYDG